LEVLRGIDLREKTALVTGGASGLGEATVRRFVAEGAKVAFADRDADRGKRVAAEIAASGGQALFVEAHMEREAEAMAFVRHAADRFGRLDVLVNNAGLIADSLKLTVDGIETTFAVNHLGYFLLTHLLLPRLREIKPVTVD
jgi:NAD(P)-dependent dehydrogenase (short-subunit alcohol dehydrogenase family)